MNENVVVAVFDVESEAFQAIYDFKRDFSNNDYVISHIALVKKTDNAIKAYDHFDSGVETADDSVKGGLIGSLVGILCGPIGVIMGGSIGLLVGNTLDAADAARNASLLEQVVGSIPNGQTALLILAQENGTDGINGKLAKYRVSIGRQDAAEIAAEVEKALALQRELEKETREKMRTEKKEEHKQAVLKKQEELKTKFETFKQKHFK